MAKLIRELIEVPERVHKGDFVLRLAEGIEHPRETLDDYVVTPQLREAFLQALDLVRRALEGRRSAGAFLHGSFGSGKSHFMAVLHLLLQHNPDARSIPELASVVAKHSWTEGKRFLLVPYHLMGATSLEQAVLGHYVSHVRQLHPEAPLPPVYLSGPLFANARDLRQQMGDESFFAQLNSGRAAAGGWGKFGADAWDAASFEAAMSAEPGSEPRLRLVSDLVAKLFSAYSPLAASGGEGFVSLDEGLSVISKHARSLGYDGLVLFLDELILWLASRVADLSFVTREGAKVSKLVEAETADRPVPIISFIARQRDLRELVGDHLPGAEKLSFSDTLGWSEGRFETITLEDRNLPAIARKRLLRPRDEEARREIDRAFEDTLKTRREVLSILLGGKGDPETFREVYPFSPALIQALVAISSVLQRERTALRVMLQLLVDQRETLRLGDLVPLGDLFDVIAGGDEPFTEETRIYFERAKRLYHQKLLPLLERHHGITRDEARALPWNDAKAVSFRGEDRLVKTLLLAALTPDVEAFQGLTASRLSALNHGSIRSPIPGAEVTTVLKRCRDWASQVGEIKIGDDPVNPGITVQLTGVDTEAILEKVRHEDNTGNRRRVIRELLFSALGLPMEDTLYLTHSFNWRGTARFVEVVFANIRELTPDALRSREDDWKIIIDFPFDAEGYSARSDLAKLDTFRADEPDTATFCWVPAFFSRASQRDLGLYVLLDYLLTGDRFNEHASHLPAVDRPPARALLDNQRSQLKQRLIQGLEVAYGVASDPGGLVDSELELADRFQSLDRRLRPQPPAAANLRGALEGLLDQILIFRFPKHPKFETDVRPRDLRKVLDVTLRAVRAPQGRVEVEKELRQIMRQIANPLRLGEMHEAAFVLGDEWRHFLTKAAATGGGGVTVGKLRKALEEERLGLPREIQDLLILVFADQTNRSFLRYNATVPPGDLGQVHDDLELREQQLPSEETWRAAHDRAARIFGIATVPSFLSASNVAALRQEVETRAKESRGHASDLVETLRSWMSTFGVNPAGAPRMQTARGLQGLLEALATAKPEQLLETLTAAPIATSAEAMSHARSRAEKIVQELKATPLPVLTGLQRIEDHRQSRAEAILEELRDALSRDELAVPLPAAVHGAVSRASTLLAEPVKLEPVEKIEPEPVPPPPGWIVVKQETRDGLDAAAARQLFDELEARLKQPGEHRLRLSWTLERRSGST